MSLKNFLAACVVAMSLGLGATSLQAQGIITGSLNGTVQDPTGAVIPGATVTVTKPATGEKRTATASSSGEFSFSDLPIGAYTVVITQSGFGDKKLENVVVETGRATGLGVEKLSAGAVETVEVSTAQSLLETVQSQVTTTFDSEQIQNLPTGGGFDELALLIPGVVSTHSNNRANTNGAGISSNGQRGRSNNFEIDGQSNNDNSVTGPQIFFDNPDALQEVQIITNNFSAQYGRDAGSVVNYITKSGTNQFHGTAFEYYEGSWLTSLTQGQKSPLFGYCAAGQTPAANGCVIPHKPRFDSNEYGGTLGGPIIRDKLFGFGSALFSNNLNGQTIVTSGTVGASTGYTPTPAGLAALAAAFPTNPEVQQLELYGPYASTVGTITQLTGTTQVVPITDGVTTAQIPVSLYSRTYAPHSTDEEILGRLDYQATKADRFFLRYFYQANNSFLASGTVITGGIVNVPDTNYSVGADWSHTFGPRIVNQLRYSFQQSSVLFDGGGFPNCTTTNLAACPTSVTISSTTGTRIIPTSGSLAGTTPINPISSFGLSTSYPQGRVVKDTQIIDNLSLNFGKHTITTGGQFEYQNSPNVFLPNISGSYTFSGANTLLTGTGTLGLAVGNANLHITEPDIAAYFQDDWKVTPSLTLNLGVRWEFFSQSINLLHNLSLANQTGGSPLWNTALPLNTTLTGNNFTPGTTFPKIPNDYRHFEPRIGFAYNPSGLKSMVIRGGYAINIAPAYYNILLNSYGSAPVVLAATITGCNNATKNCFPSGGATYTSVHALDNGYLVPAAGTVGPNPGNYSQTFVGSNFKQPITQTYTLGIQQEIGRIAVVEARYVGAKTSGDFQSVNGNPTVAAAVAAFPNFPSFQGVTPCTATTLPTNGVGANVDVGRVHCGEGNVRIRTNTSFENYSGLQTSINSRNYHGLTANFAYTWSRTIDNASEIFSTFGGGATSAFSANPLDPNVNERGVSGQSYPNVTSLGLTYVDPHFKQNHSIVGKVLGGFQFNTIYLFNSGQPFTPYQLEEGSFCDNAFDTAFNSSVDACRPIRTNSPTAAAGTAGVNCGNGIYIAYGGTCPSAARPGTAFSPLISPSSVQWLINNQAAAIQQNNPYAGVGRNTLRGDTYNNMDASVFKNNKINEHVNLQLQATFFNALNRGYYGTPDPAIEDSGSTFLNFHGNGGNNRNVQIGARVLF